MRTVGVLIFLCVFLPLVIGSFPFDINIIIDTLQQNNFSIQQGTWDVFNVTNCYTQPSCFGNNPSSPYVTFHFPHNPVWNGSQGMLLPSQVVIFVGLAPPPVRYYGFTPYLFTRYRPVLQVRSIMFDSLTDTLNMNSISTSGDGVIALYSSPNVEISKSVASILGQQLPESALNALPLPGQLLQHLGISETADTISFLGRFAFFQNETAGKEYLYSSPGYVLLATPRFTPSADLFPYPTFRPYAKEPNENFLNNSLNALASSVIASFSNNHFTVRYAVDNMGSFYQNGFSCINRTLNCNGDNRDARYLRLNDIFLGNATSDFIYVVGVVHKLTKKATYSNLSVYNQAQSLGIAAVGDNEIQNSAVTFIPNDDNKEYLYAYRLARNCTGQKFCLVVPQQKPTGVPVDEAITLVERVYVEPSSNVAPATGTVLSPIIIQFSA